MMPSHLEPRRLLLEPLLCNADFVQSQPVYKMLAMMVRGATDRNPSVVASVGKNTPRILAIDYGRKRIGLALSDELGVTAQPLAILLRTNRRSDLRRLREICREHGVGRILVGHPVRMTGASGEMAVEAARFAARLAKELGIPTELADERLTSWEAEQLLAETRSSRPANSPVDDLAAAVLLREYLEKIQNQGRAAAARKA